MFAADSRTLQRLEPLVRRVLIVDPNLASARLLSDLVRQLGSRELLLESDERQALEAARDFEPQLIFTERAGPRLDGERFARKLRRGAFAARMAPIIMMTADATAVNIRGARDAGVHEFLRKPFTAGDLLKRVEAVTLRPRRWVEGVEYVGPDRRRFNSGDYAGPLKRSADHHEPEADTQAQRIDQCLRILKSALAQYASDPFQALRAIRTQAAELRGIAVEMQADSLALPVQYLEQALAQPNVDAASLAEPVQAVLDLFPDSSNRAA